jgi:hypothetical protein
VRETGNVVPTNAAAVRGAASLGQVYAFSLSQSFRTEEFTLKVNNNKKGIVSVAFSFCFVQKSFEEFPFCRLNLV